MLFKKLLLSLTTLATAGTAMAQQLEATVDKSPYGNNIITITPVAGVSDNVHGGAGIGLSYERVLDKNAYLSAYIPVLMTMGDQTNTYTNETKRYKTYYFMPGVKFYPTKNRGVVRYAVGASLFIASGTFLTTYSNSPYYYYVPQELNYTVWGAMILNSLNICPTPHLYVGLECGLGFSYSNKYANTGNNSTPLTQGSFKIGFRF
jgi:hypothetical protein